MDRTESPRDVKGGDGVLRLSLRGEPRSLNPNVAPIDENSLLVLAVDDSRSIRRRCFKAVAAVVADRSSA